MGKREAHAIKIDLPRMFFPSSALGSSLSPIFIIYCSYIDSQVAFRFLFSVSQDLP